MSEQAFINSVEFARGAESMRGTLPVSGLARLHDLLHSTEGDLRYTLTGFVRRDGKPGLRCEVSGMLALICQRCLKGLPYRVDIRSELLLAADEEAAAAMDEADEFIDVIVADPRLDVASLIEDEVLLDIPMAPRHADGCDGEARAQDISPSRQAFSVLAGLKSRDSD